MAAFVALLRAVNVGGTGKLPMAALRAMAEAAGFASVRTFIASGNLLFDSGLEEAGVKAALEARLATYAGRPVGVLVRTAEEMAAVAVGTPFPDAPPNRTLAIFLDAPPPADALAQVRQQTNELLALGSREIFVAYGEDMARSRLRVPAAAAGTARNMNTVAALARIAGEV